MKRRLFWLLALAGAVWLYLKRGARRPEPVTHVPPASPAAGDPAEELRRKLDETKEREEPPVSHLSEPEPGEPASLGEPTEPSALDEPTQPSALSEPEQPSAPVVSEELDARRREIHERARAAADEMRDASSD